MQISKWMSLSPLLFAAACVVPQARYDRLQTEYHAENQARRQLEDEVQRKDGEVSDLRSKVNEKDTNLAELQKTADEDKTRIAQLETALKEAQKAFPSGGGAESDGVTVFRTNEGFAYSIADKLLFSPGSTEISEGGKKALAKIATQIKEKSYPAVRIEGHTDADPVVRTKEKFPLGNHELAMERALAVFGVLIGDNVDSKVLSLAAFGPNCPVAQGATDAAKAKNRRVEIHVAVPNKG
jgi:chemotaxis protein MotB